MPEIEKWLRYESSYGSSPWLVTPPKLQKLTPYLLIKPWDGAVYVDLLSKTPGIQHPGKTLEILKTFKPSRPLENMRLDQSKNCFFLESSYSGGGSYFTHDEFIKDYEEILLVEKSGVLLEFFPLLQRLGLTPGGWSSFGREGKFLFSADNIPEYVHDLAGASLPHDQIQNYIAEGHVQEIIDLVKTQVSILSTFAELYNPPGGDLLKLCSVFNCHGNGFSVLCENEQFFVQIEYYIS